MRAAVIVGTWNAILRITIEKHSAHSKINLKQRRANKSLHGQNCKAKSSLNQLECNSAIGFHLLQNPNCAAHYHDRQFWLKQELNFT